MKHKQKSGVDNITTIKTSRESHLHRKKHFHKNPLFFKIYADFEDDNEMDVSSTGNKTINIYKQNPVLHNYHNESDWFVNEVTKLENELAV